MSKDIPDNVSYHPTHPLGTSPDVLTGKFLESCNEIASFNANIFNKARGVPTYDEDINIDNFYISVQEMREAYTALKVALEYRDEDISEDLENRLKQNEKLIAEISLIEPQ